MNFREQLKNPASIGYIELIVQSAITEPNGFEEMFGLMFDADTDVAWRAGWVCDKIGRKFPELFSTSQIQQIADYVLITNHHGVRRGFLTLLNDLPLPNEVSVELINQLFDWMILPKADVSAQVLSMKILYKICIIQPDFKQEMLAYLDNCAVEDYTPGYRATRKKIIKLLNRQ
ncbi:MAG: hypothetical protein WCK78_10855 [Paludibacter sp.]